MKLLQRTTPATAKLLLASLPLLALLGSTPFAAAQSSSTPDARDISPAVMLLIDTSGSMERMGACACTTPGCAECLPTCNAVSGVVPANRWANVLQALTGTYNSFGCEVGTRVSTDPDAGYYLPHYNILSSGQNPNGILDTYATRVRFGLMTFDNTPTVRNQPQLLESPLYVGLGNSVLGLAGDFSYGPTRAFQVPGCASSFALNNGARSELATGYGRLLSPGPDSSTPESRALLVESELSALRPYGATPIAGILSDYEHFLVNDPDVREVASGVASGDRFHDCRKRYIILITDGYPNADMRGAPYFCENAASCPYDEPEIIARRLCDPTASGCNGDIDGIFVVGFNVNGDTAVVDRLNAIAAQGGTGAALFADDLPSLKTALSAALDQTAPGTTSRAVPVMSSTAAISNIATQSQFNAGFVVGTNGGPWSGVLERKRTECSGTAATAQTVDATDRFHTILNARVSATRDLWTVVPTAAVNSKGYLLGASTGISSMSTDLTGPSDNQGATGLGGATCVGNAAAAATPYAAAESGLARVAFATGTSAITAAHLNAASATERDAIIDWVRGDRGTLSNFGDVYHSSPVVVGRPQFNLPDESYNEFRRRPEVANRPTVLYVGTNDGILHAFAAEPTTITAGPHAGTTIEAGTELWGFIPPAVFSSLKDTQTGHVYTVDGTPYVRDVFYRRTPGAAPDGSIYHTVLMIPLGRGGGAYVALDVTDPLVPTFLWQFSTPEMGLTLGAPALAQVLTTVGSALEERAVAILPAGQASSIDPVTCGPQNNGDAWDSPDGCVARGNSASPLNVTTASGAITHRCWGTRGRHVYFVDPATGQIVQHLADNTFNAPMNGGVGVYSGDVGTITTRAFMNDADGFMWRFDMSASDPHSWTAAPFADMFSGMRTASLPAIGQPAYPPPVISTDVQGRVVVIQGTGNPDYLDGTAPNRVASYAEELTFDTAGNVTLGINTNWTIDLPQGEQVTGPIQLYNKVAYFSTFASSSSADACALGTGRIWGVDYVGESGALVGKLESSPGTYVTNVSTGNEIVLGVSIAQQLTCVEFGTAGNDYDPYLSMWSTSSSVSSAGPASFQLVALTSGGGTSTTGASITETVRNLPAPAAFTRVNGFASRAD